MSITSKDLRELADALEIAQAKSVQAEALYGLVRELYNNFGENAALQTLWYTDAWQRANTAFLTMPLKYDVDELQKYIPEEYKNLDWYPEEDYGDGKSTFCTLHIDGKGVGVVRGIGIDLFVASGCDMEWTTTYGPPRDTVQEAMKDLVEHVRREEKK